MTRLARLNRIMRMTCKLRDELNQSPSPADRAAMANLNESLQDLEMAYHWLKPEVPVADVLLKLESVGAA